MYRQEEPEINLEQLIGRLRNFFARFRGGGEGGSSSWAYIVIGIFLIALVGWLGTGVYTVDAGEQATLRKFGKFLQTEESGLHWYWPAPVGTRDVVNIQEVRRLEIGVRESTPILAESLMITGDENIVDLQLVVQFDIFNSITDEDGTMVTPIEQFLFRSADPDGAIIKSAAESALRQVVGQRDIDDVLTELKEEVQIEVKDLLQQQMTLYQTGIRIREVKLQRVLAPSQVQDAFDDVVKAQEDKQRIIRLAEAYEADILPRAKGEAARTIQAAEAFKAERVAKATGEAGRFLAVLTEFRLSEDVTRQRLYLEAIEVILAGVKKFIVEPETGGVLPILPLTDSGLSLPGLGSE